MRVEKEHGRISEIGFFFLLFSFFFCLRCGGLGMPGSDRSMFLER